MWFYMLIFIYPSWKLHNSVVTHHSIQKGLSTFPILLLKYWLYILGEHYETQMKIPIQYFHFCFLEYNQYLFFKKKHGRLIFSNYFLSFLNPQKLPWFEISLFFWSVAPGKIGKNIFPGWKKKCSTWKNIFPSWKNYFFHFSTRKDRKS